MCDRSHTSYDLPESAFRDRCAMPCGRALTYKASASPSSRTGHTRASSCRLAGELCRFTTRFLFHAPWSCTVVCWQALSRFFEPGPKFGRQRELERARTRLLPSCAPWASARRSALLCAKLPRRPQPRRASSRLPSDGAGRRWPTPTSRPVRWPLTRTAGASAYRAAHSS